MFSPIHFLTEQALRALDANEREVVCGDFAESGLTGLPALCDLMTLVTRRKTAEFSARQIWVVFALIVLPVGLLLSVASLHTAEETSIYLWLYASNSDLQLVRMPAFWREFAACIPRVLLLNAALAASCWTGGVLLGASARRNTFLATGALLAVLISTSIFGLPSGLRHVFLLGRASEFQGNAVVFANKFYGVLFPQLLGFSLVILPVFCGIRTNVRYGRLPHRAQAALLAASVITMLGPAFQNLSCGGINRSYVGILLIRSSLAVTAVAVIGPITYLFLSVMHIGRRR